MWTPNCVSWLKLLLICTVLLAACAAEPLPAEELKQSVVKADDGIAGDQFGAAIAASGDILVVAAPWVKIDGKTIASAVYVFLRDQSTRTWVQHQRLTPNDGAFSSFDLTIAIAGETIVVGAYDADVSVFQEGAVYIFDRATPGRGDWTQTAKLTAPDVGSGGHFGSSVAIAEDLVAVGASGASGHYGSVRIFQRDRGGANSWGEVTNIPSGAVNEGSSVREFGSAVALDGDRLFVGAARADVSYLENADGAVYVFQRNEINRDDWSLAIRLIAPGADQCLGGLTLSQFFATADAAAAIEAKRCSREDINTNNDNFGNAISLAGGLVAVAAQFAES